MYMECPQVEKRAVLCGEVESDITAERVVLQDLLNCWCP